MGEDHDRIEELLAGYVLRSLSGEDASRADRLLTEHVPGCPMCRDALAGFQGVVGELALAPTPSQAPELLRRRIEAALGDLPARRSRPASTWAAAAAIVAVLGMAGWNVMLGQRAQNAENRVGLVENAVGLMQRADSSRVLLQDQRSPGGNPLTEVSAPGLEQIYLMGHDVPTPAPGNVYWVWFGSGGRFVPVGSFVPEPGLTVLPLTIDPSRFDQILITEERAVPPPSTPAAARWQASLTTG